MMSRLSVFQVGAGAMLLLALGRDALAQTPHTRSQTSVVQRLAPDSAAARTTGRMRELKCRGKPGIAMRVHQDPSPRDPRAVTMELTYERLKETRVLSTYGMASVDEGVSLQFIPGSCTWGFRAYADTPPEPLVVYFDVPRNAQDFLAPAARDTSDSVAVHFPDMTSLPRYLSDSSHFWLFYVDDLSNLSISHRAWPLGGTVAFPGSGTQPAPAPAPTSTVGGVLRGTTAGGLTTGASRTSDATALYRQAELRCRGGSGLGFAPGPGAGDNLVLMTLNYPVSPAVPGETGRGLAPGSCAWADRTGLAREPGKVLFITAGNAQLRQAQSGSTVDRSPTAAERWPDAHTIPVYLSDPGRFWRFTVIMLDADSARQHGPWKPSLAGAVAGPVTGASPTRTVSARPVDGKRTADSSATSVSFDPLAIRSIVVTPGVNSVEMRFKGLKVMPLVQVSTLPPFRESSGRWTFSPDHVSLSVARVSGEGADAYSAASTTRLRRDTLYYYLINAPKPATDGSTLGRRRLGGSDAQATGTFRTLHTSVTVRIGSVRIIDDSDDGSSGDLSFAFTVNGGLTFKAGMSLSEVSPNTPLDLDDGATYDFSYDLTDPSAPDLLRIHAAGFDNDGVFNGTFDASWNVTPGGDGGGDWNYARAEYHLDDYPGRTFNFPFRMRTGPGSKLQFEVEGRVSVTRN